jgi:hypothetical protein
LFDENKEVFIIDKDVPFVCKMLVGDRKPPVFLKFTYPNSLTDLVIAGAFDNKDPTE